MFGQDRATRVEYATPVYRPQQDCWVREIRRGGRTGCWSHSSATKSATLPNEGIATRRERSKTLVGTFQNCRFYENNTSGTGARSACTSGEAFLTTSGTSAELARRKDALRVFCPGIAETWPV